jgi:hypothetical protein
MVWDQSIRRQKSGNRFSASSVKPGIEGVKSMVDYLNQLTALIPQGVREKVLGNSGRELLAAVTDTLVIFGNDLLHLETGQSEKLIHDAENINVAAIAVAAKRLLSSIDSPRTILLLLAPSEFAATQQNMPGMTGTNLRSAITLQRDSILPACDDTLALATANENPTGNVIALWTHADQLSDLFDAFAQYGLTLAAIAPRILALSANAKPENLLDDDGSHTTFVRNRQGVLEQWLQIKNDELKEQAYAEQWQAELAQFESEAIQRADKLSSYTATGSRSIEPAYTFFPAGSLAISRKAQRVRQFKLAAAVLSGDTVSRRLTIYYPDSGATDGYCPARFKPRHVSRGARRPGRRCRF